MVLIHGSAWNVMEIGLGEENAVTMEIRLESMLSCRFSWMTEYQVEDIEKFSLIPPTE